MFTQIGTWLSSHETVLRATRDLIGIAAVPAAIVMFGMAVLQYQNAVNNEQAKALVETRKRYADLMDRVRKDPSPDKHPSIFAVFQELETIWYLHKFNLLHEEMWTTYQEDICRIFLQPLAVKLWADDQVQFAHGFVTVVKNTRDGCKPASMLQLPGAR